MVKNICVVCGKEFEALKSTKKYCSIECNNKMRRIKYANKSNDSHTKEMPEKECLLCNKKFRPKTPAANQRSCCYECMPEGTQLKRGGFVTKLKEQYGGKCMRCGYSRCTAALDFHHKDPNLKDFGISDDNMKLKDAIEEAKKCVLICSNCHRELHAGLWNIKDLKGE